jgi:hypothetical protein
VIDSRLDCRGLILGRGKRFFSFYIVKTGCGINPASYTVGTGDKAAGA